MAYSINDDATFESIYEHFLEYYGVTEKDFKTYNGRQVIYVPDWPSGDLRRIEVPRHLSRPGGNYEPFMLPERDTPEPLSLEDLGRYLEGTGAVPTIRFSREDL